MNLWIAWICGAVGAWPVCAVGFAGHCQDRVERGLVVTIMALFWPAAFVFLAVVGAAWCLGWLADLVGRIAAHVAAVRGARKGAA